MPLMQYYAYRVEHQETGEFYFGSRSMPYGGLKYDQWYRGGGVWPRAMKSQGIVLHKTILAVYDELPAARERERSEIIANRHNPLCRNIVYCVPPKPRYSRKFKTIVSYDHFVATADSSIQQFLERLNCLIKEEGSASAAARRLGISPQYISDMFHRQKSVSDRMAAKLGFEWQLVPIGS